MKNLSGVFVAHPENALVAVYGSASSREGIRSTHEACLYISKACFELFRSVSCRIVCEAFLDISRSLYDA